MSVIDRFRCWVEDLRAAWSRPLLEDAADRDAWRARDPRWAALRDEHLRAWPRCAARSRQCRGRREVHHVRPRHLYPELAYDARNLITLCEYHHLALGHGSDWGAWVPEVRQLAERSRVLGYSLGDDERQAVRSRLYVRHDWHSAPAIV